MLKKVLKNMPEWFVNKKIYRNYFLLSECKKHDFAKLYELVKFLFAGLKENALFNICLRYKKWIIDTSKIDKWTVFMKDKVYLDGYMKCKDIEKIDQKFRVWKIKIEDTL